jgi:hypothetical protein
MAYMTNDQWYNVKTCYKDYGPVGKGFRALIVTDLMALDNNFLSPNFGPICTVLEHLRAFQTMLDDFLIITRPIEW